VRLLSAACRHLFIPLGFISFPFFPAAEDPNEMRSQLRFVLAALLSASLATVAFAADKPPASPASATYLITNDDGPDHSYVSFFTPGGTPSAPTLTFSFDVSSAGLGIAGGYFPLPRLATPVDGSSPCLYASDAGTADIAGINIPTRTVTGNFLGSADDAGDANGIGVVVNDSYLYAGYSASNTIGTFAVLPGCQLSFLGDTPAAGLNGGSVAGMALHGQMLVVTYADGSIESFNVSNGTPVSNGDEQNSTGYTRNNTYLPEGLDITSDGHYAIFGDSSLNVVVEVSDISSGHLTATVPYVLNVMNRTPSPGVRPTLLGANSAAVRLSPDESLLYISSNEVGSVSATFFNAQTGVISGGCSSPSLNGFFNPWTWTGALATRDNTGTGGVLYVAEYSTDSSFIGVLTVNTGGGRCTLTESAGSEVNDQLSPGLLSITTYPSRSF
jgi:hypothetical protein